MVLIVASRKKHSEEMAFELGTVNVRREQISIKCLLTPFYVPGSILNTLCTIILQLCEAGAIHIPTLQMEKERPREAHWAGLVVAQL